PRSTLLASSAASDVYKRQLQVGEHLRASDIVLPDGITLVSDPALEVAVLSAPRAEAEPAEEEEGEGEAS
ncbi:MAG: hypothetical protein KUG67_03065, partial [Proteobacteria bacterium]|nr:hypothetical protein [Pseudomonadota bacterium]